MGPSMGTEPSSSVVSVAGGQCQKPHLHPLSPLCALPRRGPPPPPTISPSLQGFCSRPRTYRLFRGQRGILCLGRLAGTQPRWGVTRGHPGRATAPSGTPGPPALPRWGVNRGFPGRATVASGAPAPLLCPDVGFPPCPGWDPCSPPSAIPAACEAHAPQWFWLTPGQGCLLLSQVCSSHAHSRQTQRGELRRIV